MSRLTEQKNGETYLKETGYKPCHDVCESMGDYDRPCDLCPIDEAFKKLAHYEDLEEQGRLIPADKIKSKIAGHSVYYGGHILDAIQCMAEGKEVGNVRYLEPEDIVRLAGGWVTGCVPTKSGNYAVRYNGVEGRDDFTTEGNHWWNVGRLHHPEEVEWKPASFKEL